MSGMIKNIKKYRNFIATAIAVAAAAIYFIAELLNLL
jgi:hypothetical protein